LDDWADSTGESGYLRGKDVERAIAALPKGLQMPRETFGRRLQAATWWYWQLSQALRATPDLAPSVAERIWRRLGGKATATKAAFLVLQDNNRQLADWIAAAEELADPGHGVAPPNVDPETVEVPRVSRGGEPRSIRIWPYEKALAKAIQSLEWLAAVTDRAAERVAEQKQSAGGPRADEPAYDFVHGLARIFEEASGEKPDRPTHFAIHDTWEGSFLDFVEAVFDPVDERERPAIAGLIRRALFSE
jgi:hypothetical protein